MKTATHLAKTSQEHCACHTKRLSTRYKTRLNVTKCHACHAKRSNETFETSKDDPFWRTYHRHGHIAIARTVANGCERLRTVANGCERLRTVANGCGRKHNAERTHPQPPDPETETGTLATHSGKTKEVVAPQINKSSLNRPPFTPDNYFGGGGTTRPPQETN